MYSGFNYYDREKSAAGTEVHDPNSAWYGQEPHWVLIEDLLGGTFEMRTKHRRYLPQEPREQDDSQIRKNVSRNVNKEASKTK